MTLEINEISIQISVGPAPQGPGTSATVLSKQSQPMPAIASEQMDRLVQRCVRDVLRHLRLKERR